MNTYGYESPLGPLAITLGEDNKIHRIQYEATSTPLPDDHPLRETLDGYFAGECTLDDLSVELSVPEFQSQVLDAIRKIPAGEVRTYAWVAETIGRPRAARAVGNALGANPIPLVVPCHRVVAGSGLGGYTGGLDKKEFLLALESKKLEPAGT